MKKISAIVTILCFLSGNVSFAFDADINNAPHYGVNLAANYATDDILPGDHTIGMIELEMQLRLIESKRGLIPPGESELKVEFLKNARQAKTLGDAGQIRVKHGENKIDIYPAQLKLIDDLICRIPVSITRGNERTEDFRLLFSIRPFEDDGKTIYPIAPDTDEALRLLNEAVEREENNTGEKTKSETRRPETADSGPELKLDASGEISHDNKATRKRTGPGGRKRVTSGTKLVPDETYVWSEKNGIGLFRKGSFQTRLTVRFWREDGTYRDVELTKASFLSGGLQPLYLALPEDITALMNSLSIADDNKEKYQEKRRKIGKKANGVLRNSRGPAGDHISFQVFSFFQRIEDYNAPNVSDGELTKAESIIKKIEDVRKARDNGIYDHFRHATSVERLIISLLLSFPIQTVLSVHSIRNYIKKQGLNNLKATLKGKLNAQGKIKDEVIEDIITGTKRLFREEKSNTYGWKAWIAKHHSEENPFDVIERWVRDAIPVVESILKHELLADDPANPAEEQGPGIMNGVTPEGGRPDKSAQAPTKPRDERGRYKEEEGKSPEGILKVIAVYLPQQALFTARDIFEIYKAHYEEHGFEAPAENSESALRTIKRDLHEKSDSLVNQGILEIFPERGKNGEYLYQLTRKGAAKIVSIRGKYEAERERLAGTAALTDLARKAVFGEIQLDKCLKHGNKPELKKEPEVRAQIQKARREFNQLLATVNDIDTLRRVLNSLESFQSSASEKEGSEKGYYAPYVAQARLRILSVPIGQLGFSAKARNVLEKIGIKNLGDLIEKGITEEDILKHSNIGRKTVSEIYGMLARLGEKLPPITKADVSIKDAGLSVRAHKVLKSMGIKDPAELLTKGITEEDILKHRNIGRKTVSEIYGMLARPGEKSLFTANQSGESITGTVTGEFPTADLLHLMPGENAGDVSGSAVSYTDREKKALAKYDRNGLDRERLAESLSALLTREVIIDDNSAFIFSEIATFGRYNEKNEYEFGLIRLLPKLAEAGIKVAVIARNDAQRNFISKLNEGKPERERIGFGNSIAEMKPDLQVARCYYLKVENDEPVPGESLGFVSVCDITHIVKQIVKNLGRACGVVNELLPDLYRAAQKFSQAA